MLGSGDEGIFRPNIGSYRHHWKGLCGENGDNRRPGEWGIGNSFPEYDEYIVQESLEAILKIGGFVFMISVFAVLMWMHIYQRARYFPRSVSGEDAEEMAKAAKLLKGGY